MKICSFIFVLFLSGVFFLDSAHADTLKNLSIIKNRYDQISSFSAEFEQENYTAFQDRTNKASGEFFFRRPGAMRWDYQSPQEQYVYIQGTEVIFYDPYLENVSLQRLEENELLDSLFFFRNPKPLDREFRENKKPEDSIVRPNRNSGEQAVFLLPRKPSPHLKELQLVIDRKGLVLQLAVLKDNGDYQFFRFKNYQINKKYDDRFFQFKIPEGIEIIEGNN